MRKLLDQAGRTYASEAGIRLADTPSPLYRLLVLSVLLSTRIRADIAVAASRELTKAGCTTASKAWSENTGRTMAANLHAVASALTANPIPA